MKKNLFFWQFGGFAFVTAMGTVLHFLFDWTEAPSLALVSAVNESTWEHMKILFFPMLIFALIQRKYFHDYEGFWWRKLFGILTGVGSIPVFFYTYNGAFGPSPDWLNILFFFLSAGLGFWMEWMLFREEFSLTYSWLAIGILILIATAFATFTFYPPKLPIFQDPITKTYGVGRMTY